MPGAAPVAPTGRPARGWPRAAALFGVTLVTSVAQPGVLVGVPFVVMAAALGVRRVPVAAAVIVALAAVLVGGGGHALWFLERGWAAAVGAFFTAATLLLPRVRFTGRALVAVACAAVSTGLYMAVRPGAWAATEWAVRERMTAGVTTAMEVARLLRGGEALPSTLVAAVFQTVETQVVVFPAMLGVAQLAGLGVAWWAYVRLAEGSDQGLGPLAGFRFSDHLVWVFIAGLVLMLTRGGDAMVRVGANAVVFMAALYSVRGAAVVAAVTGGMSFLGAVLLVVGLMFMAPLLVTAALVVGVGDTWLDIRARLQERAG